MALPNTSLSLASALVNSVDVLEQLQNLDVRADNTTVDARGIADTYVNSQVTKQKQTVTFVFNWYNSNTDLEATNLDITLWTLDGTAYIGQLKSGTLDVTNKGPEVSGIAKLYEVPVPTSTDVVITSDLMVVTEAALSYLNLTATNGGFAVAVAITFADEDAITVPGILKATSHKVVRGEVQMENVTITLSGGTPTAGEGSLLYQAMVGGGTCSFDVNTGVNEYANNGDDSFSAMMSKFTLTFRDKDLIKQSLTLEVQSGMVVTAPS